MSVRRVESPTNITFTTTNQELVIDLTLPEDLVRAIEYCKNETSKIEINQEENQRLNEIKSALDEYEEEYKKHLNIGLSYFLPSESKFKTNVNSDLIIAYKENLSNLDNFSQKLDKHDLTISPILIKRYIEDKKKSEEIRKYFIDFKIIKEKAINIFSNRISYFREISYLFNKHKGRILETFSCNDQGLELYKIDFIEKRSETHNKGRKPVFINLKSPNSSLIELVWKPRNANIDSKVIELFGNINDLKIDECVLPTYKIFMSEEDNFSVWQKIAGSDLKKLGCQENQTPFDFIQKSASQLGVADTGKGNLLKQIKKMTSIISRLEISDLHHENVILTNKDGSFSLVPIDLEVLQRKYITHLMVKLANESKETVEKSRKQELDAYDLNQTEQSLIDRCKQKLPSECSWRILLMGTQQLMSLCATGYFEIDSLVNLMTKTITDQGYQLKVKDDKLREFILIDLLNGDVPIFTEKQEKLYYGSAWNSDKVIGTLSI